MVFKNYAKYYDLLYKDKDYPKEADYIFSLLTKYKIEFGDILELGCGTGKHASLLSEYGYNIHGIDFSEDMLERARFLARNNSKLFFEKGDVRTFEVDKIFDAVLSLFHVVSYQVTNQHLKATFNTVNKHLKKGGFFIFDCWYGPAVLSEKPERRIKELENEEICVSRIAEPVMYPQKNCVDVNYTVAIEDKITNETDVLKETHKMRYLFDTEIELLLNDIGIEVIASEEWITGKVPSFETWGVCFICKK
ncbi:MAG TPA: class I SAM-dependent methyltransferase [Victivallales bacterium]|nr:class I SAM-dependent methyltransferase [Victivallales bacterium]